MIADASTPTEPIALDAAGVSRLFPFGIRTWRRMDAAGKCPRGHKVGQKRLWLVADLKRWAEFGFPTRDDFEAMVEGGEK